MKNLDELKNELIEYGKLAGVKNFTPGYSGNFSARYGDKILITSSGSSNGYLTEKELVLMDFDGVHGGFWHDSMANRLIMAEKHFCLNLTHKI